MSAAETYKPPKTDDGQAAPSFRLTASELALSIRLSSEAAKRWGDKFWGINTGTTLIPIEPTLDSRMGFLRSGLHHMHDGGVTLDDSAIKWMKRQKNARPGDVNALMNRSISLPKQTLRALDNALDIPGTVGDAFRKSVIAESVRERLTYLGSPLIILSDSFEAAAPAKATNASRHLGYTALDSFMFAAGGTPFVETVRAAAIDFYDTEVVRRDIAW